jgi:hypothetical protein
LENLIDYSILLGTDYGTFKLNEYKSDSLEILKYYVENNKDYKNIISQDDYDYFEIIKKYYMDQNFHEEYKNFLEKPKWNKPKLMELKKRLLELDVDEDYIDSNNEYLDFCYNKIKKGSIYDKFISNGFENKKQYYQNKFYNSNESFEITNQNSGFYTDKMYKYKYKNNNSILSKNIYNNSSELLNNPDHGIKSRLNNEIKSKSTNKIDDDIFYFEV